MWLILKEAVVGFAYPRRHTWLATILLVEALTALMTTGPFSIGLPLLARGPLHTGARGFGPLLGGVGLGQLVGILVVGTMPRLRRRGLLYGWLILAQAPVLGGLAMASLPVAVVLLVVGGVLNGVVLVMFLTLVQSRVNPAMLGRVMGVVSLAFFGLGPVSQAAAAPLAQAFGPAALFVTAGVFFTLAGASSLLVPSLRRLDQDPVRWVVSRRSAPPYAPHRTARRRASPAQLGTCLRVRWLRECGGERCWTDGHHHSSKPFSTRSSVTVDQTGDGAEWAVTVGADLLGWLIVLWSGTRVARFFTPLGLFAVWGYVIAGRLAGSLGTAVMVADSLRHQSPAPNFLQIVLLFLGFAVLWPVALVMVLFMRE